MIVLFDTNVVLDLLLDRAPWADSAEALFERVENQELNACLCATTLTTIHYLIAKSLDSKRADVAIVDLLALFDIAAVNRSVLHDASLLGFADFEDAVLHEAARHHGALAIVTRNERDFAKSTLPIYAPNQFESMLRTGQ